MVAAKLAVVTVVLLLALIGSVSCQAAGSGNGGYGGSGNPVTQPPTYPPDTTTPKPQPPPGYLAPAPAPAPATPQPQPPMYRLTSPSPPPVPTPTYPLKSPSSPEPMLTYPTTSPSSPPPSPMLAYPPPPSPSPPPPTPTYPPPNPSPPPSTPSYSPPSPSPSQPPPTPTPTYPTPNPSPPSPTPSYFPPSPSPLPPTPTYPPPSPSPSPSPPPPTPTYPPPSPSPPPPTPSYSPPSPPPPTSPPSPSSDDAGKSLEVGYYRNKCGSSVDVEAIVRKHVNGFDTGIKAGLIRLFYHDCFVRGCDASILLDPTSTNQQPEKSGIPNFPSMRGYEVIDAAKDELEAKCPGKVSCADIIAFAARDASYFLSGGGISFDVPAGRYDGNVSLASETLPNLPPPFAGYDQLEKMFADKGLGAFDMVTLTGAHSIGRSHCSSFTSSGMDPALAAKLQASCTSTNGTDNTVTQDYRTPDDLDNQYYQNVLDHKVLFTSDAALTSNDLANYLVRVYAIYPWLWQDKFAEAMVRMGRVEIKTAATGEIRRTCRKVNSES